MSLGNISRWGVVFEIGHCVFHFLTPGIFQPKPGTGQEHASDTVGHPERADTGMFNRGSIATEQNERKVDHLQPQRFRGSTSACDAVAGLFKIWDCRSSLNVQLTKQIRVAQ